MLGRIKVRRRSGWQRIRWLDEMRWSLTWWIWVWANFGKWWRTGKPGMLQSMGSQTVRHDRATEQLWQSETEESSAMIPNFSQYDFFFNFKDLHVIVVISQFSSVAQSCPTLWDPMNRRMPGLPVHCQLLEFTQTRVHAIFIWGQTWKQFKCPK